MYLRYNVNDGVFRSTVKHNFIIFFLDLNKLASKTIHIHIAKDTEIYPYFVPFFFYQQKYTVHDEHLELVKSLILLPLFTKTGGVERSGNTNKLVSEILHLLST